jgi:hypothetical protein
VTSVHPCEVPEAALLYRYKEEAGYADCYVTEIAGAVSQAAFVEAFYTSALFKVERTILKLLASRPSSDAEARQLAAGMVSSFAAWRVEGRSADQLLLADFAGRTRSWLMALPVDTGARTRLYFGSAIVPRAASRSSRSKMGLVFHALLGFHKLYSRLLLTAARSRLLART